MTRLDAQRTSTSAYAARLLLALCAVDCIQCTVANIIDGWQGTQLGGEPPSTIAARRCAVSTTLIKDVDVITVDAQRRIIEDGYVLVDGDRIAAVGESLACPSADAVDHI